MASEALGYPGATSDLQTRRRRFELPSAGRRIFGTRWYKSYTALIRGLQVVGDPMCWVQIPRSRRPADSSTEKALL